MDIKLGKIEKVDLRSVWKHEALDFTQWLALPENIEKLNEKLGLSLVDVKTEQCVGKFHCDILARDEFTNKTIVIENQLEATNHDHLGKIITYASGLKASTIIWIVKEAQPEHAMAIEWLNEHMDDDISFFLIEVELWKIDDSKPASVFNIIEKPNDFGKNVKKISKDSGELSYAESSRLEFWENFNDVMAQRNEFNIRKASTDHWYDFSIGKSACYLSCDLLNKEHKIRIQLWIPPSNPHSKDLFDELLTHKDAIETSCGIKLDWMRMDGKKACRICTYLEGLDFSDSSNYSDLANKMIDILVLLRNSFKPFLK